MEGVFQGCVWRWVIQGLGKKRGIQGYIREEVIQMCGVGKGRSRGLENFIFNSAKLEDFKITLHFMYATCTDQHVWPEVSVTLCF